MGDTFDRYYFFPSDKYNSAGNNPVWPVTNPGPVYNTLARLESGAPMYDLGVPAPGTPPTVYPAKPYLYGVEHDRAYCGRRDGASSLPPDRWTNVLVGMYVVDLTDHRLTATANLPSAQNTTTLNFSSTGTAPNNIVPGMRS